MVLMRDPVADHMLSLPLEMSDKTRTDVPIVTVLRETTRGVAEPHLILETIGAKKESADPSFHSTPLAPVVEKEEEED